MIKINLLPIRAARRKENIRRQVSVFFLCLVFTLSVLAYLTISMSQKITRLNTDIETTKEELKKSEAIAKMVEQIKKDLKTLEDKTNIIVTLEANRSGPVRFMDALTNYIVPDKIWLTSLTQTGARLQLEGIATDNQIVAEFMTNLESSDYFDQVDLISTQQVSEKDVNKKYKKFTVTCTVENKTATEKQTAS